MTEFSSFSGGPSVDSLGLKLSGTTGLPEDLKRGDEVEITVRGYVSGHIFEDKRNSQTGDIEHTIKYAKVAIDELESVTVLAHKRRNAPVGQTAFTNDGATVDATTGSEIVTTGPHDDDVVDAEVVAELGPGEPPEGVDPATGEISDPHDGEPPEDLDAVQDGLDAEDQPPALIRHPQVPEEAWDELNHEQRAEVNATVDRIERFLLASSTAENPTDETAYRTKGEELIATLANEYGVELLDSSEITEADEGVLEEGEPPPPRIGPKTGPRTVEQLEKRRRYLLTKRGLAPEAEAGRSEEIAEIERRLRAQGAAA